MVDDLHSLISSLKRGMTLVVGRSKWRVENNYGLTATYVVKAGSSGKKLYTLWPEGDCIEVREINPGSGAVKPGIKPAARGCSGEVTLGGAGTSGGACCVLDNRGRKVACFTGKDASAKAAALQRIAKRSRTSSSCAVRGRR